MATTISREFIADKLISIFPNLDTSIGSIVDQRIISPITNLLSGYSGDDFVDFIVTRIQEFDPDLVTTEGSANYDVLVAPLQAILEPLFYEIKALKGYQSLSNYAGMPNEELDALVANYFTTRSQGSKATGTVRVWLETADAVTLSTFVKFYTKGGINFIPQGLKVYPSDIIYTNQDGNYYYIDVPVVAENEGSDYNVVANQIIGVNDFPGNPIRITNPNACSGGESRETNDELYERTLDAISVRNLVTKRGIRYLLQTNFPRIRDIEVVGSGDEEMDRDLEPHGIDTVTTITQIISGDQVTTVGSNTVTGANYVHILGRADVYMSTRDIIEDNIDIVGLAGNSEINLSSSAPYSVNMPLVRIKNIERLDPIYLTGTGQYIPNKEPIDVRALRDFSFSLDKYNLERAIGTLRIFFELPTSLKVDESTVFTADNGETFVPLSTQNIAASGMSLNTGQHISETDMDENVLYNDNIVYYYFDVSVQSNNVGSNSTLLDEMDKLSIENYTSEGWWYRSKDSKYAFSADEEISLQFTPTFNDGISIAGEAVRITYEYAKTVKDAQDYIDADENRVVTTDILAKHFQPAYVDLAIRYESNTLTEETLEEYIRNYINDLEEGEYLEISDLINLIYSYGVSRVVTPINIFVLNLKKDRTTESVRFDDRYNTSVREHFIARNISITKI